MASFTIKIVKPHTINYLLNQKAHPKRVSESKSLAFFFNGLISALTIDYMDISTTLTAADPTLPSTDTLEKKLNERINQ